MRFSSTRNISTSASFADAIFRGLAPDGGLYRFEYMPEQLEFFMSLDAGISFNELSVALTYQLLKPEIDEKMARTIIDDAFNFEPVLHTVHKDAIFLELFHGPSCAFKDFGATFLASVMNVLLTERDERAIIITATSGDTGSAVAQAFHGKDHVDVVILYPSGRVSPLQEKQLTTLGGNVTALEVRGNFDDCQRMAKTAFTNPRLSHLPLSSANSINIGRLIPQSFYYIWAWTRMKSQGTFAFVVPSGNFGNITAGLYALAWGMNGVQFVAATNANDIVPEYLKTGAYKPRPSVATLSNAMDVGNPSNYERLCTLYDNNVDIFRQHVEAWSVDDETTRNTIRRVYDEYGYVCCPHTAVGWQVATLYRKHHPRIPTVILSTAHPGKFVETVEEVIGMKPNLPEALSALEKRPKIATLIGNTDSDLENYILNNFA